MTDPALYGHNLFGEPITPPSRGALADDYYQVPFSVLSAREGAWQERKRGWVAQGIASHEGRADELAYSNSLHTEAYGGARTASQTSIFDPVLCELCYRWFCPPGGQVVDPFAGGSVRGIIAGMLGYRYHGIDLRPEQVAANYDQKALVTPTTPVEWVVGDAAMMLDTAPAADFAFTCPPYGDLEQYSDDPRDLSNMTYPAFIAAYRSVIMRACHGLAPNRFAGIVVGDFRDPRTGYYRGFVADTINAYRAAGLHLYNDAVLLTAVGTAAVRSRKTFEATRKLVKTHQNLLIFVKGDPREVVKLLPHVDAIADDATEPLFVEVG